MTNADAPEAGLSLGFALEAPPEKVWRALTVPAYLERWLLPLREEGRPALRFSGASEGVAERIEAEIVTAEPPRRLQWAWREEGSGAAADSLVTFTLAPREDGGTWLTIEQRALSVSVPVPANSNTTMALAA